MSRDFGFQGCDSGPWSGARAVGGLLVAALTGLPLAAAEKKPAAPQPQGNAPEHSSVYQGQEGKARATLFGTSGEGYKFVYVFDRSGSMGGNGARSLRAVKAELQRSLDALDTVHQFQIVFYNQRPVVFNPSGAADRLAFATASNKQRALRFIESIAADGGTEHEAALRTAIRLRPDVIFFLTDGDDPQLPAEQIDALTTLAGGITINTIEFGPGPKPEAKSFLKALAEANGGQYAYVDASTLTEAK